MQQPLASEANNIPVPPSLGNHRFITTLLWNTRYQLQSVLPWLIFELKLTFLSQKDTSVSVKYLFLCYNRQSQRPNKYNSQFFFLVIFGVINTIAYFTGPLFNVFKLRSVISLNIFLLYLMFGLLISFYNPTYMENKKKSMEVIFFGMKQNHWKKVG